MSTKCWQPPAAWLSLAGPHLKAPMTTPDSSLSGGETWAPDWAKMGRQGGGHPLYLLISPEFMEKLEVGGAGNKGPWLPEAETLGRTARSSQLRAFGFVA